MLLAIDPGLRAPGIALFKDGKLFSCHTYSVKEHRGAYAWLVGGWIGANWLVDECGRAGFHLPEATGRLEIAYEMMECYVGQDTQHAHNDLLECVGTLSALITRVNSLYGPCNTRLPAARVEGSEGQGDRSSPCQEAAVPG